MKSKTKLVLLFISLMLSLISNIYATKSFMKNPVDSNTNTNSQTANSANTGDAPYSKLVTADRPHSLCKAEEIKFKKPGDKMGLGDDYNVFAGPKPKPNNYMKETEKLDMIVYLFDYLDDVFQTDMANELDQVLQGAHNVPEDEKINDPYTPEKLLFFFSGGVEGRDPWKGNAPSQNVNIEAVKKYRLDINTEIWEKSFSARKISNIIKTFGWGVIPPEAHFFKRLIDKYDFTGTGRLDSREFLFYAIWENYKNYAQCKQFCFKKIIEEKIDPLFTFLDCDNDGYINSENIWEGLKYLKRSSPEKYNLYQCELPRSFNKFYRTHAPNDFILKNFGVADGYLNREEFRKGILLGYWERQANGLSVTKDDSINRKSDRWDATGTQDKDCIELLQMFQS